jgi:4-amino-4-deoxy-L-arabinose transferase-like glycosyltransferase
MKNTYRGLAVIIGLHLILGLVYDRATPIFEASDEGAHYAVVRWIAQGHGLPVQDPHAPSLLWAQEGSQPPLYYLTSAGLTAWINTSDYDQLYVPNPFTQFAPGTLHNANLYRHPWGGQALAGTVLAVKVARWWSLLLSCLTVGLTFWLARRVLPKAERVALVAAALVAFNPMALFINASVNNDNLLMLLSTAAVLLTVVDMQAAGRWSLRRSAALGLLLGLAALTKVSGLVLWPVAGLGVTWGAWKARDWKRFVFSGLVIAGVAVAVSGWWFWRNLSLYGDWLGLETMVAIAGPRPAAITLLDLVRQEGMGFYLSYWGVFGAFTILPPAWVQFFYGALTVLSVAGGGLALWRLRAWPRAELWLLVFFIALTLVGVINWTLQTLASQGRLLFGAIAPLSIFMAVGLAAPGKELPLAQRSWRAWGVGVGMGSLGLVALVVPVAYIAPHYLPPRVLTESDLPKDLHPAQVTFDAKVELVGYTADETLRHPGERQRVTLYWRALQPMTADYVVALHLLGRGGEEVGKIDTWPGGGNAPTSQWPAGGLLADTYWLPISTTATAPSQLKLDLAFWLGQPDNKLPMKTAAEAGGPLDQSLALVVGRLAPAQSTEFKPALAEGTRFEYGIALLGVDTGQAGRVTLYWKTDQVVPGNYTVFLHVLDASGTQVTQADGPPLNNDWPTSAWIPGQALADVRQVADPAKLAPGRYTVVLGLYEPESGARVAAFRADGAEWPDDMVVLKDAIEIK